ncbi:MAG TPA: response regulator [Gaiellaceae bacterium]
MIAEDEEPLRAALSDLISLEEGFELAAIAADADSAIEKARATQPDVAVLDARMPGGGGPRAAREIAVVSPGTRAIALSAYDDRARVLEMLQAGAIGYLVKGTASAEIIEAIARAARGQSSLPTELIADLFAGVGGGSGERPGLAEQLVEQAADAVVVVDGDGRILLVNEETERLFSYPRAELAGELIESLLPDRLRDGHVMLRTGYSAEPRRLRPGLGRELWGRRRDGSEFRVDISLSAIDFDGGRVMAAFIRDDTNRLERAERDRDLAARSAVLTRIVSAGEQERRQIASDIHDDSIQVMTAAGMRLQILRKSLESPEQLARLDELERTIQLSIARLRRLIFELRPPALDLDGLGAALKLYVADAANETGAIYDVENQVVIEPDEEARVILYRIAQEVLANVRKHAAATSVKIAISDQDGGFHVRIADNGIGFEPAEAARRAGVGLAAVRERAELAGGWIRIESSLGSGATVEYWIPGADR